MSNRVTFKIKNIENLTSTHVDLETSEHSDSTLSDSGVKRRKTMDYFYGEGSMLWEPKSELLIQEINITGYLLEYRERNIRLATLNNNLSDLKQLSLSYVFPANKFDEEKCAFKHLEEDDRQKILDSFYSGLTINRATPNAGEESDSFEATNEMELTIKSCCNRFIRSSFNIVMNSEAAFIKKHLQPFIDVVFLENDIKNLIYTCTDAPIDDGTKPDIAFGINYKRKARLFFFVEVKRPGQCSIYQDENDYVKLLKQMKTSVDGQIDLGVPNPTSLGLLVEGFRCTLYVMHIKDEGVYIPVQIKRFFLPEVSENLVNVPSVVEGFLFVKEKLFEFKEKLTETKSKDLVGWKKGTYYAKSE
ncbi:hypothetical protein [Parasitella parasitica]|uniref:Uncharacterized protein n=1 Tax=Parasitella parasitica TaxID=35722 RepID=A0A0B7NU81_9FUNG|nr:hypothetical protein [Parasitella parasitica]